MVVFTCFPSCLEEKAASNSPKALRVCGQTGRVAAVCLFLVFYSVLPVWTDGTNLLRAAAAARHLTSFAPPHYLPRGRPPATMLLLFSTWLLFRWRAALFSQLPSTSPSIFLNTSHRSLMGLLLGGSVAHAATSLCAFVAGAAAAFAAHNTLSSNALDVDATTLYRLYTSRRLLRALNVPIPSSFMRR